MRGQSQSTLPEFPPRGLILFTCALCASSAQGATRAKGVAMTIAVFKVCGSGNSNVFLAGIKWVRRASEG